MEFPRFVFISPGKTKCQDGSFDGEIVEDQANFDAAISAGYSDSVPEALKAAEDAKILKRAAELEAEPAAPASEATSLGPDQSAASDESEKPAARRPGRPRKED